MPFQNPIYKFPDPIDTIVIEEEKCSFGDIRLENRRLNLTSNERLLVEGNVEVCVFGEFFPVCDQGWDSNDARVACRALNLLEQSWGEQHCFVIIKAQLYPCSIG